MDRDVAISAVKALARSFLPGQIALLQERTQAIENPFARTAASAGVVALGALADIAVDLVADFAVHALDRLSRGWPVQVTADSVHFEDRRP